MIFVEEELDEVVKEIEENINKINDCFLAKKVLKNCQQNQYFVLLYNSTIELFRGFLLSYRSENYHCALVIAGALCEKWVEIGYLRNQSDKKIIFSSKWENIDLRTKMKTFILNEEKFQVYNMMLKEVYHPLRHLKPSVLKQYACPDEKLPLRNLTLFQEVLCFISIIIEWASNDWNIRSLATTKQKSILKGFVLRNPHYKYIIDSSTL